MDPGAKRCKQKEQSMASYNRQCVHCGEMIEPDSRLCRRCGSRSPFGYRCPNCLREIGRGDAVCPGCGRSLTAACPFCGGRVFAGGEKCGACGKMLMIRCENKRCGEEQFFENQKCTACGKAMAKAAKQIEDMKNGAT
jgi:RNA polymerase subunit RPABC4/transcription elongation factor Spt4